jgi:RHS repeat-associated protein
MSSCSSRLIATVAVLSSLAVLSAPLLAKETGVDQPVKSLGGAVHADPFTGVATTSIPIEVPPGRNGMQPSLALTYNSAAGNGWLGMGWDLEQEGIYRQSKWGLNYSANTGAKAFEVKMAGVSGELVPTPAPAPSTQWSAKVEGGFSRIEKLTAGDGQIMWKVTTKQGRKYFFGQTAASRQVDPASANRIFGWLLDRVEDLDGNYMIYTYQPDPLEPTNAQKYLQQIDYTGNGATTPTNSIRFWLDDGSRPDQTDMYTTNYRVKTKYRLKTVEVKASCTPTCMLVRAYKVGYSSSVSTLNSLLTTIQQFGKDAIVNGTGTITNETVALKQPPVSIDFGSEGASYASRVGLANEGQNYTGFSLSTGDFNGDGRTDFMWNYPNGNDRWVYLAKADGSGTFEPRVGLANEGQNYTGFSLSTGDFNGDGRTDFMWNYPNGNDRWVYLAKADGSFSSRIGVANDPYNYTGFNLRVGDFNGDGKSDFMWIYPNGNDRWIHLVNPGHMVGRTFTTGLGGATTITYDTSANDVNNRVPFAVQRVKTISTCSDWNSGTSSCNVAPAATTYAYTGGYYHIGERDLRGVAKVSVTSAGATDADKTVTTTEFLQGRGVVVSGVTTVAADDPTVSGDASMKGLPFRVTVTKKTDPNFLYAKTETTYRDDLIGTTTTAPYFTPQAITTTKHYNSAGVETKQTQTEAVSYDAYGNLTLSYSRGDFTGNNAITSDDTTTTVTYAPAETTNWLIGFPTIQRTYAGLGTGGTKLSETLTYYDGTGSCTTPAGSATTVTKGHVTKVERWLNGGTNPISGMEYNAYGGVTCTRDPKGNTTTMAYDPTNIFPLTSTNALGHVTTTSYYGVNGVASDTGLYGQAKSVTDPNGKTSTSTYDALGRKLTTTTPDGLVQTMAYHYGGAFVVGTQHVQSTTSGGGLSVNLVSKAYFDGLGRTTKKESPGAADGGGALKVLVTETQYDIRGLTKQTSLPYIQGSESATGRWRTMTYDALGRMIQSTNPDGTSSQVCYNAWTTTSLDPKLHKKVETKDALGRLVTVQEYMGTQANCGTSGGTLYATTSYSYDLLGNLLGVTDAKGNVSSMTYDTLNRKLTMHDPDMGNWSYTYDANGNLLTQVDAKNQKLCFSYDALNRRTQKNYGTTTVACGSNTVVYAYDDTVAANNGKGRLKQVTDPAQTVTFQYDSRGRITQSAKTLDGTTYTITSAYDGLGRLTSVNYPTSPIKTVTYTYDGPQLKQVSEGATNYVTYAGWNALGQPATSTFGNGVVTTHTYANTNNATCTQQSFRLCTLKTAMPGSGGSGSTVTFAPEADTFLHEGVPTTSYGATDHAELSGSVANAYRREAYLRFNVTGLPVGATITSASLTLVNGGYSGSESVAGGTLYKFAPTDAAWVEGTPTWSARAGLAGSDASGALGTLGAVAVGQTVTFTNLQSVLSGNGRVTFAIKSTNEDGAGYYSKEWGTAGQRPVLSVTYTTGGTAGATHQDLRYDYEANGNVWNLYDATVAGGAGDQHFSYDDLDRLTLANGPYGTSGANASLTYAYDEIGNLTNNSQVGSYTYPASGASSVQPHAVSSTGSGSGSTVTFAPEADTFLHEGVPTTSYGATDHAEISGSVANAYRREAYLRFNITGLPAGATITSASLTLVNGGYSGSESTGGGTLYKFAPTDAAWVEGTPTWSARAGLAGSDASGALGTLGAVAVGQTVTFTNLQSVLIGNGRVTFAIKSTNEDGVGYYSKEWGTAGQRPVLSITYTTAGANTYSYDGNGNMTGGGGRTYTWNPENKPLTTVQGGTTTTFVYDGDGGRVKKIVGTTTTRYISKLYECDNTNCSRFIWAGSTRIATIAVNTGATQYWHGDHLGSSSVITDSTGAKVQTVTYYPFGGTRTNQSPSTPAIDVPYKYTGKELDSTGLYYYEARYYDPTLARFISADTLVPNPRDPQDLNRYAYAGNNPLKYTDPTGHFKIGKFLNRVFDKPWARAIGWAVNPMIMQFLDPATRNITVPVAAGVIGNFACGPVCGGAASGAARAGLAQSEGRKANVLRSTLAGAVGGLAGGVMNLAVPGDMVMAGIAGGAANGAASAAIGGGNVWQATLMGGATGALTGYYNSQGIVDRTSGPIWNGPNTLIGAGFLALNGVASVFTGGMEFGLGNGGLQVWHAPLVDGGVRLGDITIIGGEDAFGNPLTPASIIKSPYEGHPYVNLGRHEGGHGIQERVMGPTFFPAYFLLGGWREGNPFEIGADNYGTGKGSPWSGF